MLIQIQRNFIEAYKNAQNVTTRFGNRRKAERAAFKHGIKSLTDRGWSLADARIVLRDAWEMACLEILCDVEAVIED